MSGNVIALTELCQVGPKSLELHVKVLVELFYLCVLRFRRLMSTIVDVPHR